MRLKVVKGIQETVHGTYDTYVSFGHAETMDALLAQIAPQRPKKCLAACAAIVSGFVVAASQSSGKLQSTIPGTRVFLFVGYQPYSFAPPWEVQACVLRNKSGAID